MDSDYADWTSELTPEAIRDLFRRRGCRRVLVKPLAARQDNDKNQIYVGKDLTSVSGLPFGPIEASESLSAKPGAAGQTKFQAPVEMHWLTPDGDTRALHAKLIFYPQYPEVRLSGFLRGTRGGPNDLLTRRLRGQESGRVLMLGISGSRVWGIVLSANAAARTRVLAMSTDTEEMFKIWDLESPIALDSRAALLDELERIHSLGWIPGTRLRAGQLIPYSAVNGGGYTLEAMLGIAPNGFAEPDFLGWEIKQHGVPSFDKPSNPVITLFTPEPSSGTYVSPGFRRFMDLYGYPDRKQPNRINFGGIYRAGKSFHHLTGLRFEITGFSSERDFRADGSLALIDSAGEVAAEWSFAKLMDHWRRKHAAACYVPSMRRAGQAGPEYRYGRGVLLAGGATFGKLLSSIHLGRVYLDPAMKLVLEPGGRPAAKRRSQFRTKYRDLEALYDWSIYYGGP